VKLLQLNLSQLEVVIEEMGDRAEGAARPASQAAAQVLYDQVKLNVASLGRHSGNLDKSIYQVYSQQRSGPGKATYQISWNKRKAPHGHLLEFGHIQRYVTYMGKDGNFYTAVRPSMRGKKKPDRRAPQSVKDAYYVPLATPKQIKAAAFLRSATSRAQEAADAAERVLIKRINNDT
jgi:hypothetical protein